MGREGGGWVCGLVDERACLPTYLSHLTLPLELW